MKLCIIFITLMLLIGCDTPSEPSKQSKQSIWQSIHYANKNTGTLSTLNTQGVLFGTGLIRMEAPESLRVVSIITVIGVDTFYTVIKYVPA